MLPAVAATAILAVCGCSDSGSGTSGGGGSPTVAPSAAPATPTTPAATSAPASSGAPAPPVGTPSGPTVVLDGTARPGVEPGCVVLAAGGRQYLLLAAAGKVPLEVPIRVRGVVVTGVLTYCQQGTPLRVVEVSRR